MNTSKILLKKFHLHKNVQKKLDKNFYKKIDTIANLAKKSLLKGGKIILFGNGGSAADSMHFAAEFVSKFKLDRKSIPAISLSENISIITSVGNDYSFDNIFSRQLESLYSKKDFIFIFSTSGNSKNIINAIKFLENDLNNFVLLSGNNGGLAKKHSKFNIIIPSTDTDIIQEFHYMIMHCLCDFIEKNLS